MVVHFRRAIAGWSVKDKALLRAGADDPRPVVPYIGSFRKCTT